LLHCKTKHHSANGSRGFAHKNVRSQLAHEYVTEIDLASVFNADTQTAREFGCKIWPKRLRFAAQGTSHDLDVLSDHAFDFLNRGLQLEDL
jgi:hypothetical protein